MNFPKQVTLVEVGPRDGLQNEARFIPLNVKLDLIHQLADTGLKIIEVTSFVSPKYIPQLIDHAEVFQSINQLPNVAYPVLVPNLKGFEKAVHVGVKEIAVFTTPSEQFSQHNTHCSVAESRERIQEIVNAAKQYHIKVRAYLSCIFACPYEGKMSIQKVVDMSKWLYDLGCYEISLGDTIGCGTPGDTKQLLHNILKILPVESLAVHFHDTYGQALANIYVALSMGIKTIDSAVSGLGGCPYAKGATGNVATEDVLYMLNGMNIETGVDLSKLIKVGRFISNFLDKPSQSKVNLAYGKAC